MKRIFYVTTAIDYVNARPHIGHAVEKLEADVLARYHRDILKEETYFLTGSDENSLKNVEGARKAGMKVEDFVTMNAKKFESLKKLLNLSFDQFIRITEKKHFAGAQKMWRMQRRQVISFQYHFFQIQLVLPESPLLSG